MTGNDSEANAGAADAVTSQGEPLSAWRGRQRRRLLAQRLAAGVQRKIWNPAIEAALWPLLPADPGTVFGLYWPFKGEFDTRSLLGRLRDRGGRPALPRVVAARAPLEFRLWHPHTVMVPEAYGIPVPKDMPVVVPEVLILPLLGFDAEGYRLGYGGGYYDRTLAALTPRPLLIGVGFELSRLDTIHPQPHDIPMDWIVTQRGAAPCAARR